MEKSRERLNFLNW